ncbi:MAG: endonuclease/exonuclease/phosphatase family protein [Anaerolineae bacterium]|nr:endonuclease/exonuclease/phosphatase family protein [Anaerolineae bacterium]
MSVFKVITYNILDGGVGREPLILKVLSTAKPDIIFLQEVTNIKVLQNFANALKMDYYLAQSNSKRRLAILSRFPIVYQNSYHPFPLKHTLLEATIEHPEMQRINFFGVHLQAHHFIFFEWWRIWEIKKILSQITKFSGTYCLVAGDFNAVAPKDQFDRAAMPMTIKMALLLQFGHIFRSTLTRIKSAGFIDCYRVQHPNVSGFSLPTPKPHVRLDYIFINQSLASYLRRCNVITKPSIVHQASDHYPVMAEFEF